MTQQVNGRQAATEGNTGKMAGIAGLLSIWLLVVCAGFWWFDVRLVQAFDPAGDSQKLLEEQHLFEQLVYFDGRDLDALVADDKKTLAPGRVKVINVVDYACPCTRYSLPHIRLLQEAYGQHREVEFWVLEKNAGHSESILPYPHIDSSLESKLEQYIPSSPAVIVVDAQSRLAYLGPYSAGPVCGQGKSYVDAVLGVLAEGRNPRIVNTGATGCFCPWQPV